MNRAYFSLLGLSALLVSGRCRVQAAEYYVAQNDPHATDGGDGTARQPFKTIGAAAKRVAAGDTVTIHGGVYRESIVRNGLPAPAGQTTTFRGAPGEKVVLSGGDLLTGWHNVEGKIWAADWRYALGEEPIPRNWPNSTWAFPMNRKEMIFADNAPLNPVVSREQLAPGTFWIDDAASQVLVYLFDGGDPNAHQVEGSVRGKLWSSQNVAGLRLENLTLSHAAGPVQTSAAVWMTGCDRMQMIDCRVEWNGGSGIWLSDSDDCLIDNSAINFNGGTGFSTYAVGGSPHNARLTFRRSETSYNNWRSGSGGVFGWAFAGSKVFRQRDSRFEDYACVNNMARGIWFDSDHTGNVIDRALVYGNMDRGVYLEAGIGPNWLTNSVLSGTRGAGQGLTIANAPSQHIWHNTFIDNDHLGAWIGGSPGPRGTTPDVSFATDCDLRNNLFWNAGRDGAVEVQHLDWPAAGLQNYVIATLKSEGNRFFDSGRPAIFQVAGKGQTFAQWQANGWDEHGAWVDTVRLPDHHLDDVRPRMAEGLRLDPELKLDKVTTDAYGRPRGAEVVAGAALTGGDNDALPRLWQLRRLAPLNEMPLIVGGRALLPRVWMVAQLRDVSGDAAFEPVTPAWSGNVWLARSAEDGKESWAVVNPGPWPLKMQIDGLQGNSTDAITRRVLQVSAGKVQLFLPPFGSALLSAGQGTLQATAAVPDEVRSNLEAQINSLAQRKFAEPEPARAAARALATARQALAQGWYVGAWEALQDASLRGADNANNDRLLGEGRL